MKEWTKKLIHSLDFFLCVVGIPIATVFLHNWTWRIEHEVLGIANVWGILLGTHLSFSNCFADSMVITAAVCFSDEALERRIYYLKTANVIHSAFFFGSVAFVYPLLHTSSILKGVLIIFYIVSRSSFVVCVTFRILEFLF